jgi:hypothetical protein
LYKASITLIPKSGKDASKKERERKKRKLWVNIPDEQKSSVNYLQAKFKNTLKRSHTITK